MAKNGIRTHAGNGLNDTQRGVQKMYTEAVVLGDIQAKKRAGMSLRTIAAEYDGITFGDVQRILAGEFPPSAHKRAALNLPPMYPAPACPKCGIVHTTKRCTANDKPRRARWVRVLGHQGWREN